MMRTVILVVVKGKGFGARLPESKYSGYCLAAGSSGQVADLCASVSRSVPTSRVVVRIKWLMPVRGLERCCQGVLDAVLVTVTLCIYPRFTLGSCSVGQHREPGMSQMPSKYSLHPGMEFTRWPAGLL